jgi:DNA-binding MurR/RpiR family transcriptional regulator
MIPGTDREVTGDTRRWLEMQIDGHRLSPAQRRIARFLLEHPEQAVGLTAGDLGQRSGASQPSVTRFAIELGFRGYPELRAAIREQVEAQAAKAAQVGDGQPDNVLMRTVGRDVANLQELVSSPWAGERLERIGSELAESRPLPVIGLRVSRPFADLFVHFASKVHSDVRLVPAGSDGDDVICGARAAGASWMLTFGFPRYPRALLDSILLARAQGLRVALVTDSPLGPFGQHVDDLLAAPVNSELTFDSAVGPLALTMGLLQTFTDALPDQGQTRLEEFDQRAADRGLFLT